MQRRGTLPLPSSPPDEDDLYTPSEHYQLNQMAALVWSVMRLSTVVPDFAWCTVCRNWYTFRNESSNIKALYRHCKTQHFVDNKGILRSVSVNTSSTQGRVEKNLQEGTGYAMEQQAQLSSMNAVQTSSANEAVLPQPSIQLPAIEPRVSVTTSQQAPRTYGQLLPDTISHLASGQGSGFMQTGAEQTPHLHVKETPSSSVPHEVIEQVVVEELNNQLSNDHPSWPRTQRPIQRHYTHVLSNGLIQPAMQVYNPPNSVVVPSSQQSLSLLDMQLSHNHQRHVSSTNSVYSQQQLVNFVPQPQPLISRNPTYETNPIGSIYMPQSNQNLHGHNNWVYAQGSPSNIHTIGIPSQPTFQHRFLPSSSHLVSKTYATNSGVEPTPLRTIGIPHVDLTTADIFNSNTAPSSETQHRLTNTLTEPLPTAHAPHLRVDGALPANLVQQPMASSEHPNKKVSSDAARNVHKASSHPRTPRAPPLPKNVVTRRCEITKSVRDVAEKMQESLFKGCGLFFVSATFQVPTTVDEAFNIMKTGTHDFDKADDNAPASELYLASWAHTQFFAAQMAALGFRFVTCNLRKSGTTVKPPVVDEWLHLSRYDVTKPAHDSEPAGTDAATNDETRGQSRANLSPRNAETEMASPPNSNVPNSVAPNTTNLIPHISAPKSSTASHLQRTELVQQTALNAPKPQSEDILLDRSKAPTANIDRVPNQFATHGLHPQPQGSPEVIDLT